jgi:hypothetical protein
MYQPFRKPVDHDHPFRALAGDEGADHHPVPGLVAAYRRADLGHLAHELVAEDVAGPHRRRRVSDAVRRTRIG